MTFCRVVLGYSVIKLVPFYSWQVRTLTNMCSAPLDLFSMLELGGQQPSNAMVAMNQLTTGGQHLKAMRDQRRRKKVSGVPNPKRMFEEAQMVRRVKAYLKNMRIITDEERLHQMSLECEAPAGGIPPPQQPPVNTNSPTSPNTNQPQSVSYLNNTVAGQMLILYKIDPLNHDFHRFYNRMMKIKNIGGTILVPSQDGCFEDFT